MWESRSEGEEKGKISVRRVRRAERTGRQPSGFSLGEGAGPAAD